jgi:hypothetical protein
VVIILESEPTFKGCMIKTTRKYYKEVFEMVGVMSIIFGLLLLLCFATALLITKADVVLILFIVLWIAVTFMMTSSICHDEHINSIKGIIYTWLAANILLVIELCGAALIIMCNAAIPLIIAIGVYFGVYNIYGLGIATVAGMVAILLTIPPTMAFTKCIKLWDWIVSCFRTTESLLYGWIKSMV